MAHQPISVSIEAGGMVFQLYESEAEFVAATAAVNQALWLRKILVDIYLEQENKYRHSC